MEGQQLKDIVKDFWNEQSCGEVYATGESEQDYYESHAKKRYELEPYIYDFAKFSEGAGQDILEIGVGMGADHIEWAKSQPRSLTGIDLTPRAVEHTKKRLQFYFPKDSFKSKVETADAEILPFNNDSFDIIYSWGVLHHSPNTPQAFQEVFRVLREGGTAKIMIYHKYSLTGYMLWIKYGLLKGQIFRTLDDIYYHHLESLGTKAYSVEEARQMCSAFSEVKIKTQLSFGDLLEGQVGQRHQGLLLTIAKKIYPRTLFKSLFRKHGIMMMIELKK